MVFTFMDRESNVTNACVCKHWSDIALDLLWKNVDNLLQLINLLAPVHISRGYYMFVKLPDANAWLRFQHYAKRVRTLRFCDNTEDTGVQLRLRPIFDDIARTRTALDILPNLHTLEWLTYQDNCMELSVLFMHTRVKHFVLSVPSDPEQSRLAFFTDICARMPHLTELDLRIPFAMSNIEDDILALLRGLPNLRKVVFPEYHLTSKVVSQLSQLRRIGVVQFEHGDAQGCGSVQDVESFEPTLSEGAFRSLWDLSLTARLTDVDRFLNKSFAPINLTTLFVNTCWIQSPRHLHTLLSTLLDNCQLLSSLYLELLYLTEQHEEQITPELQINFSTLKPLLSFPNLTTFELTHEYPVDITLAEIEELARNWPSLERLSLNCEPLVMDHFTLDLRALLPFARYCPKLRKLGLFLNATTVDMPDVRELGLRPFPALRTLSVGVSKVQEEEPVALFLSQVCPLGCEIEFGVTWLRSPGFPLLVLASVADRCLAWESVKRLLPSLIKLRREERKRTKRLVEEVEDLRIRSRLLTEKRNLKTDDSCVIS
ncbi:hypothetical protein SERLA73DRAFT_57380 [Serpula lacrymans var. lacrymans S7.3]|uniref:F-box domain-containing protein n=2 Tax=Serpula lacrymans var. lacrymans TaxID=341189 RepID=F8Q390_SERL3|nr:hypothetical protein SERLA73DRAFT_57380 [Serpula lacrymans var. lacrymans S7.3]